MTTTPLTVPTTRVITTRSKVATVAATWARAAQLDPRNHAVELLAGPAPGSALVRWTREQISGTAPHVSVDTVLHEVVVTSAAVEFACAS